MLKLRKGSVINEHQYGVSLVCEITTDVTEVDGNQQEFKAKVKSLNGAIETDGDVVEYLIGGAYGAHVEVLQY